MESSTQLPFSALRIECFGLSEQLISRGSTDYGIDVFAHFIMPFNLTQEKVNQLNAGNIALAKKILKLGCVVKNDVAWQVRHGASEELQIAKMSQFSELSLTPRIQYRRCISQGIYISALLEPDSKAALVRTEAAQPTPPV